MNLNSVKGLRTEVRLFMQALLAVGVGAAYAAPYLGRMVALGKPGMENIQEMQVWLHC